MNETPRPEIAALGSATLCEAFQITAAQRPGQVALRTLGGTTEITYAGFLAQVRALAEGRFNVSFDDIQAVAADVLRHRLILSFEAEANGITPDHVIEELLSIVPVG